ncbi:putative alpha-1A adrenergic receptor-like [Apostichopus japonicus]|uniref:Putative alpha-1A adrenergic receptor-like n=1 Tax=Stichopus japonicus TaxID=307972 RepID=A0A2G8KEK7_STIJA|nr:putative alpha-1A adrenergic receptor-like [Apostichopus japonicus]
MADMENNNAYNTEAPYEFDSYGQRLFIAFVLVLVFLSGVFGNGLVVVSVLLSRRLRNVTNIFVVNLAIADLLACTFLPATIIALSSPHSWPFESQLFCTSASIVIYVTIGVSLYTLASIAVNRCVLITQSVERYQRIYGNKSIVIGIITFLWAFPAALVLIPFVMGMNELGYNSKYHSCTDTVSEEQGESAEKVYDLLLAVGLFPVPTILLFVSYWKIYSHVLSHAKKLQANKEESDALSMSIDSTRPTPYGEKTYAAG